MSNENQKQGHDDNHARAVRAEQYSEQQAAEIQRANDLVQSGWKLVEEKKLEEAKGAFMVALELCQCLQHAEGRATCLHEVARCLYLQGQFAKAEPLLRKSLNIKSTVSVLSGNELSRAITLQVLGVCLTALAQYTDAEAVLREAVEIESKNRPSRDPNVLPELCLLGDCLLDQGKVSECEEVMKHALSVVETSADSGWGRVPAVLALCIHLNGGNASEVDTLMENAKQQPQEAYTLLFLGEVQLLQSKSEAETNLQQAVALMENEWGKTHPYIVGPLCLLGECCIGQGKYSNAEGLFARALAILHSSCLPTSHPLRGKALLGQGKLMCEQGKVEESQSVLIESVRILASAVPNNHWTRHAIQTFIRRVKLQKKQSVLLRRVLCGQTSDGLCAGLDPEDVDAIAQLPAVREQLIENAIGDLEHLDADQHQTSSHQRMTASTQTQSLPDLNSRSDDPRRELGRAQEEKEGLQSEATRLEVELRSVRRQLAEQEEVIRLVTEENERQVGRQEQQLNRSQRYQREKEKSQCEIRKLRQQLDESQRDKRQIARQLKKQRVEIEKGEHARHDMTVEMRRAQEELQRARNTADERQRELALLTQQNGELRSDNDQLQEEIRNRERRISQLEEQNREANEEVNNLQQTRESQQTASNAAIASLRRDVKRLERARQESVQLLRQYDSVLDISDEELQITGPRLGGGSTEEVKVGKWRGISVAVKTFHEQPMRTSLRNIEFIRCEVSLCSRVRHPNVMSICGAIVADGIPLRLVMEMQEASLSDVIDAANKSDAYLSVREQVDLAEGCVCGVMYLHQLEPALLHGDIRPTNVLVTRNMEAKVADLGTSRFVNERLSFGVVSAEYLAPERDPDKFPTQRNTAQADVYSLGVSLIELFSGVGAARMTRNDQLLGVHHPQLRDLCDDMIAVAPADRVPVDVALMKVCEVKQGDAYRECPAKRLVKGKLHRQEGEEEEQEVETVLVQQP